MNTISMHQTATLPPDWVERIRKYLFSRMKVLTAGMTMLFLAGSPMSAPSTSVISTYASSVSQYGISWTFDRQYPVGHFANGDWWVVGPVTITSMTPSYDGARNGWEVNPIGGAVKQGFDNRVADFDASRVPSLPYKALAGQSIVKAIANIAGSGGCIDDPHHPCYLQTAAVLTVLDQVPPDNGTTVFRPPYVGTSKPLYSTNSLRGDLLPKVAPPPNVDATPSLAWVKSRFERVQLDHKSDWTARYMHPEKNLPGYGSDIGHDIVEGGLRLLLNDSFDTKKPALVAYVQQGIDFYHMMKTGSTWPAAGGHFVGRKLPIVFAAILLDDRAMKIDVKNAPNTVFSEDNETYFGKNGVALWGVYPSPEKPYWDEIRTKTGSADLADPYGYVDGGGTDFGSQSYQLCCTSQPYKGEALVTLLLPGGRQIWNHEAFFKYVDRWVSFGLWAQPDPCQFTDPGPNYTGACVPGDGRFSGTNGTYADFGYYRSAFADNMWKMYR